MGRIYDRQSNSENTVAECGSVAFEIPTTPPTTPPYSLIAYATGGFTPSVYPLTVDRRIVSWTVTYRAPTTVTLSIVDAEGKAVINPSVFSVQATNGSTACLRPSPEPKSPISVVIDLLSDPKTCMPLIVHVDGGQKPYTVTLVPAKVAVASNITMGASDDTLYWVNTFPPPIAFHIAVSDSQGIYAYSERFITVSGNNDTSCPGQVTHSFNSRDPTGQPSNNTSTAFAPISSNLSGTSANGQNNGGSTAAIVGGAIGGAILLLGLLFILFRRRKRYGKDHIGTQFPAKHEAISDYIPVPLPFNHPAPGRPSTSAIQSDNVHSTSTSWQTGVTSENTNAASRKAARLAQERGAATVSAPIDSGVQVHQHVDAMRVVELPPAYVDASTPLTLPPGPPPRMPKS